jgi:hypothetical protein
LLIGFALGALFLERAHDPRLQHVLSGVSAAAAGMLIATGLRLMGLTTLLQSPS